MSARSFEQHLAAAVAATWAEAIPTVAVQALWARGDAAPVYAVARALPPSLRPSTLAWYAGLDPQPRSARVVRAATEALRAATSDRARLQVLALVPLKDPAVLRLARHHADREARLAIDMRALAEPRDLPDTSYSSGDGILPALLAVALARRGRRDEAEAALSKAMENKLYSAAAERALIPAVRHLDAWGAIPATDWQEGALLAAGFVAGQVGEGAVRQLRETSNHGGLLVAAALGAGRVAEEWREELSRVDEALTEEFYQEGLITWEEKWARSFARAVSGPRPQEDVAALVAASIAEALAPARSFAEGVLLAAAGPRRGDEEQIAERARRLLGLVASPKVAEEKLTWRTLRPVVLIARKLATWGASAEVRRAIEALEQKWGPALQWGRDDDWVSSSTLQMVIELLACAEGRALESTRIERAEGEASLPLSTRARVCEGLARDGHADELRGHMARLLAEPLEPGDVAMLAHAAVVLDPGAGGPMREATEQVLAALPATGEAAAAWLRETDFSSWDVT